MKPNKIFLIRHGESEGNADRSVYAHKPDHAIELTALGQEQAQAAGQKLKTLLVTGTIQFHVSPFTRARQTFQKIAESFAEAQYVRREDPRIREQEWGHWTNIPEQETIDHERKGYGAFYYRIPDGESCADVYDRISCFLNSIHRNFEDPQFPENLVIVTHGMLIRVFLMRWFHLTVEEFEKMENPLNCAIIELELDPNTSKYRLISERP